MSPLKNTKTRQHQEATPGWPGDQQATLRADTWIRMSPSVWPSPHWQVSLGHSGGATAAGSISYLSLGDDVTMEGDKRDKQAVLQEPLEDVGGPVLHEV